MKRIICFIAFVGIFTLLSGLSCSSRGNSPLVATSAPVFASAQDWTPPVFPGAVPDEEIRANLTAVASTPEALDQTACICFGFPVRNAIFHAYRSDAGPQEVMDFYSAQMAAEGWKEIKNDAADSTLLHETWQLGEAGPLVAYLMVTPMSDGRTLIYLSAAESYTPQEIIGE